MRQKNLLRAVIVLSVLGSFLLPRMVAHSQPPLNRLERPRNVTAFDLILAMNTLRVSNGLQALIEDPIINAVAQNTAEIMAANQMSWHIGDVRGRIQAAGYGGGATVWATENFAVGVGMGIDQIMLAWADAEHMRPATNPAYCHVGAGVATSNNGRTYYILQAAYTSANSCGDYVAPSGGGTGDSGSDGGVGAVPQLIFPVKVATPDREGNIYHVVEFGQSFWAIAVAYQTTINDLEFWNNLSRDIDLQVGQRLVIPSSNTVGYSTPTPVGLVVPAPPDAEGKVIHTVESYHTLITISQAYEVPLDTIVSLNAIQVDWPLQIGQTLLISPGFSTPTPESPLAGLTPDADGNYYHTIASGETLSGIAIVYEITVDQLMAWNGLVADSIIRPGERLLLLVTPPTPLPTTVPPTLTATSTPIPPTATPTPVPSPLTSISAEPTAEAERSPGGAGSEWLIGVGLSILGLILILGMVARRRV